MQSKDVKWTKTGRSKRVDPTVWSRDEYDPLKEEKLLKEEKMRTTEEQTNVYQCSINS